MTGREIVITVKPGDIKCSSHVSRLHIGGCK